MAATSYAVQGRDTTYVFNQDRHDLSGFSDFGDAGAHSDDYRTVSKWELSDGMGVSFGRGQSSNPDRAEAYLYLDAQDDAAAAINGRYRLVVLNAANETVSIIDQGTLEEVRNGDPSTDSRGDWGTPFPYRALKGNSGEVIGGKGYSIGLQIETTSGTATFSTANSTMVAEGYRGRAVN